MQNNVSVARFVALRDALMKERAALQKRLREIDSALGGPDTAPARAATARRSLPTAKPKARAARSTNAMSLREVITKVTAKQALTLSDLVAAIQRAGYKFESKEPRNSLGAYLYSKHGRKHFKRVDGKFSALK